MNGDPGVRAEEDGGTHLPHLQHSVKETCEIDWSDPGLPGDYAARQERQVHGLRGELEAAARSGHCEGRGNYQYSALPHYNQGEL